MQEGNRTVQDKGPPSVAAAATAAVPLRRTLTLTHTVLYGLGVTIGAGIYVLIGAAAARAGMHAPVAFVLAAILIALTGASFAELAGRTPLAAGEAAYVREAFRSDRFATAVGLLVVAMAIVSAAAISVGGAGYVAVFLALPQPVLVAGIVFIMGAVAAWGIKESVTFAGTMTVIEVGGLLMLVIAGAVTGNDVVTRLPEVVPPLHPEAVAGILSAALLAVFAFIGFETVVNLAEEVHDPKRMVPRAILLTLVLTTLLYVLVVWVALVAVSPAELARSSAPLALVFERLTGGSQRTMSAIAIVATLNGIIVQIIMASRVLYGLARQGNLPRAFQDVNAVTQTPLFATAATTVLVAALALLLPLEHLADITSRITLAIFAIVNAALIRIKQRGDSMGSRAFVAPAWVPWAGLVSCVGLLVADLALGVALR
ncbi:MAG: amino acid permease [Hyphomicrobiaceae bacterium]|nr:MAG: amino acid permease [Hyphomicrobiaceae bacterium]